MKNEIKTYSCPSLHNALYLAPDVFRHCCKRFFVNGRIKGDVEIYPVAGDEDIDVSRILQVKRELYNAINRGEETECSCCPFITPDKWDQLDELKIKYLSIESHSICNMRCTYCNETYYGGLKSKYSLNKVLEHFIENDAFSNEVNLIWGGGEPTLMDNFEEIFELFHNKLKPKTGKLFTNALKYSPLIEKYLTKDLLNITISTDAGSKNTFQEVRGVNAFDRVFGNIRKYCEASKAGVTIKYILTDRNSSLEEINGFVAQINKYNLNRCNFQLSSDFKSQYLTDEQTLSVFYLYRELLKNHANTCYLDDHLRPRWSKKIKEICNNNSYGKKNELYRSICNSLSILKDNLFIVWGAGQLGYMLMKEGLLSEKSQIAFFVDKDQNKHGQLLEGIEIKHPDSIKNVDYPVIIAASRFYAEIYRKLLEMGIKEERIVDSIII